VCQAFCVTSRDWVWVRTAGKRNRSVEFLYGHHGGVAVGPFPNDQVVEAFGKLESATRCEEETFPELGLFMKKCGEVYWCPHLHTWVGRYSN
jgi:hypothetical protein